MTPEIKDIVFGILLPLAPVAVYKAVRVEAKVEDQDQDIKEIKENVNRILDHLLNSKR